MALYSNDQLNVWCFPGKITAAWKRRGSSHTVGIKRVRDEHVVIDDEPRPDKKANTAGEEVAA